MAGEEDRPQSLYGIPIDQFARLSDGQKIEMQENYRSLYGEDAWAGEAIVASLLGVSAGYGNADLVWMLRLSGGTG